MAEYWQQFMEIGNASILGVTAWQLIGAFAAILVGYALKVVSQLVIRRLEKLAARTSIAADQITLEAIGKPLGWSVLLAGIFIALEILPVPVEPVDIHRFIVALAKAVSIGLLLWVGTRLVDGFGAEWARRAEKTESRFDDQLVPVLRKTFKTFLIVLGVILALQQLGYSVTSLLAGLGIGTAAIAFASKDTLANFFGAIVVFFDRPFQVGDWIDVDGHEGTVEEVGLRTTRLRTFANSLITLPNSVFTTSPVNNWSGMKKRRIKTTIGITYDASVEQVQQAVQAVRDILGADERIKQDFFLVNFSGFGASSLDIFLYAFTETTNWAEFLQVREEVFLEIMKAFQEIGVDFAFPTQTVHLAGGGPGLPADAVADEQPDLPS